MQVEQIFNFCEEDLEAEVILVLDTSVEIFIWVGEKVRCELQRITFETVLQYVSHNGKQPNNIPISVLYGGNEQSAVPIDFARNLFGWSGKRPIDSSAKPTALISINDALREVKSIFSYKELLFETLPQGVQPSKLEVLMITL